MRASYQVVLSIERVFWATVVLLSGAVAQQAVSPPPKPADSGPSLEVTMKFIQEMLNDSGQVNYASYVHDNATGQEWSNQFTAEASHVVADPATCRIGYHWKTSVNGKVASDGDAGFTLRAVRDIVVRTGEQHQKKTNTDGGHPTYDARIDPPAFVLVARRPGNVENVFFFRDEDTANRVAKAMVHAIELCGGGQAQPF